MKPKNELKAFGYIDKFPPIDGSWKSEAVKLIDEAERMGADEIIVGQIKEATDKINANVLDVLYGD